MPKKKKTEQSKPEGIKAILADLKKIKDPDNQTRNRIARLEAQCGREPRK